MSLKYIGIFLFFFFFFFFLWISCQTFLLQLAESIMNSQLQENSNLRARAFFFLFLIDAQSTKTAM